MKSIFSDLAMAPNVSTATSCSRSRPAPSGLARRAGRQAASQAGPVDLHVDALSVTASSVFISSAWAAGSGAVSTKPCRLGGPGPG